MDNIEILISDADPAKRHNVGGPGPLQLQDPGPVFSQTPQPVGDSKRFRGWRVFATVSTIAAVASGIVVWASWEAPNATGPAGRTALVPEDPTTGPSESASTDDYMVSKIDYGLPNFLVPAHQDVYFQDNDACNALDLRTIKLEKLDGSHAALPYDVNAYPVVGCMDDYAAIQSTDLAFANGYNADGGSGIYIARWVDGAWIVDEQQSRGINNSLGFPVMGWPALRAMGNPRDSASKPEQLERLRKMGLDDKGIVRLMGPDTASWMGKAASNEFHEYSNMLLSITYPYWELKESMFDEGGNPIADDVKSDLTEAERYDLQAFDIRGKQVLKLVSVKKGSLFEPTDCSDPETSYRLDGESPSRVLADSGALKLALITKKTVDGDEHSWVGLFPGDMPATGRACDVRLGVDRKDRTLFATEWVGPMGFKNQAERDAYLKSPEYTDAKKVASLLTFDHVG